jgi:glycosyltransferase involved in cell wall biosynthesis
MRVLFLSCHLPYPRMSGGRLREHELLRRISVKAELHLCAVTKTPTEDQAALARVRGLCASISIFPAVYGSPGLPAQVRRHCSDDAARHIRHLLQGIDLVHVEGFYLMQLVPDPCPVPVLLVEQNVEYSLSAQRVAIANGNERQRGAFREFRETRAYELEAWRRADRCAAVTAEDRDVMLRAVPGLGVRVVPDGIDHLGSAPLDRAEPLNELVFVANFAYQPNADAALWFCREIFPRVRERVPEARVLLVGNAPPPEVLGLSSQQIEVTGRVGAVEPYLDRAAVVVAPLRIGGGIKVKVLEALARGKAIVSTSLGVQGLGSAARESVAVTDEPEKFAAACALLLEEPASRSRLEQRALALAATLPSWDEAAAALLDCYRELELKRTRPERKSLLLQAIKCGRRQCCNRARLPTES